MSIDKKNKFEKQSKHKERDLNHLNDILFRHWLSSGLKEDILKIRGKYGVFREGYVDKNNSASEEITKSQIFREQQEVRLGKDNDLSKLFSQDLDNLMNKYKLPPNAKLLLKEYFFSGPPKKPINDVDNFTVIDIDLASINSNNNVKSETMKEWNKSDIPHVSIIIPSFSTLKEAQNALKKNWKVFENIWRLQGWKKKNKRNRPLMDKDIKDRALELLNEPKKVKGYKELEVKEILKKEFPDRKIPDFESLRKMKSRYKNKKEK